MPTLYQIRLPVPKNGDEFEQIVVSALRTHNPSDPPRIHGRNGQKQNGIDIYYEDNVARTVGVQCKCVQKFSWNDVLSAVGEAESADPPIEIFTIALAMPREVKLQKLALKLSRDRANSDQFRVGLWFWEDISRDLAGSSELAIHYPNMFGSVSMAPSGLGNLRDDIAKKRYDAYQALWNYFHHRFIPIQRHPDYDWEDACEDIALDLGSHGKQIKDLYDQFGAILPTVVGEELASAASTARQGNFEIAVWKNNIDIPDTARRAAQEVYNNLNKALKELREDLESHGLRF